MEKPTHGDVQIAYQNKDIFSKFFGESLKEKYLEAFGIHGLPKIVDVLPTNLPSIKVNELRIDNLFLFEDGMVGIIDYESIYSEENILKYLDYISGVVARWYREFKTFPKIRIIIIYTADVPKGSTPSKYDFGQVHVELTEGFLSEIDGDKEFQTIEKKLQNGTPLTREDLMKLCILPLSYRTTDEKQRHIEYAVDLTEKLDDERELLQTLAGIYTFTFRFSSDNITARIQRRITMSPLAELFEADFQRRLAENTQQVTAEVTNEIHEETARDMLTDNEPIEKIKKYSHLSESIILKLAESMGVTVCRK